MITGLLLLLAAVVIAVIGGVVGRRTAPTTPPSPKPRFGLLEAEAAAPLLPGGRFTPETAATARVVTAIVQMEYRVPEDVAATRQNLDSREASSRDEIEELRQQIADEEAAISTVVSRRQVVNGLAGAFGL